MKKIFTSFVLLALAMSTYAQDGQNELKNFRFGLKATPSLNWYKPEDAKKFESNGVKLGFGWGLQMEFRLSSVAVLVTGLQVDYDRGNINFFDTTMFGYDNKEFIYLTKSEFDTNKTSNVVMRLNDRYYRTTYVTLPFYLKMKTKEIGAMTYFGEFGLNTSFRLKSKANDEVTEKSTGTKSSIPDLDNTKDMNLFKFQLHIGGGAEYNLSGSTSLVFGLSYNLGFSNVVKKESEYLYRTSGNATVQQFTGNNFALTIGILF
jgi:hypothetical protein